MTSTQARPPEDPAPGQDAPSTEQEDSATEPHDPPRLDEPVSDQPAADIHVDGDDDEESLEDIVPGWLLNMRLPDWLIPVILTAVPIGISTARLYILSRGNVNTFRTLLFSVDLVPLWLGLFVQLLPFYIATGVPLLYSWASLKRIWEDRSPRDMLNRAACVWVVTVAWAYFFMSPLLALSFTVIVTIVLGVPPFILFRKAEEIDEIRSIVDLRPVIRLGTYALVIMFIAFVAFDSTSGPNVGTGLPTVWLKLKDSANSDYQEGSLIAIDHLSVILLRPDGELTTTPIEDVADRLACPAPRIEQLDDSILQKILNSSEGPAPVPEKCAQLHSAIYLTPPMYPPDLGGEN